MGVRRRLQIVLAVVLLALVIFAVLVASRLALVSSSGSVVTNQVQPSVRTASDIALNILDVDLTASRYALTQAVAARNENAVADNLVRSGLRSLSGTAQGDQRTRQASEKLETTYLDWFTKVISPTMSATSASQRAKAREAAASTEAAKKTDALRANLSALQTDLYLWRAQATDDTAQSLTILKSALAVSLIGILLLVFVLRWGLRRWVTQPLIDVAADLRQVADGDTTHQIGTTGPAEIAQTAQDAEDMRRRLMREIDEAIAAREALDQRGPVVAALRRELQGRVTATTATIPGLETAGLMLPAEGVLAGDWFTTQVLADGRLAITLVDVSGHGPLAGLTALKLKYAMAAALEAGGTPRSALEAAASTLSGEVERFATACVVTISGAGEVVWANAGHPAPIIIDRRTVTAHLDPTGPLLSGLGGAWTMNKTKLASESTVLFVSDGFTESQDGDGVELKDAWSDDYIATLMAESDSVRGGIERLAAAARERADQWRVDDLTIVGVRRS